MLFKRIALLATSTFLGRFSSPEAHIHAIIGYNGSMPIHGSCHIFFAVPVIA